jgi:hypothetical protein
MLNVSEPYRGVAAANYAATPTRLLWCCDRNYVASIEGFGYWQVRSFRLLTRGPGRELEVVLDDRVLRLTVMPWDNRGPQEADATLEYLMSALRAQGAARFDAAAMDRPVWETQTAFGGAGGLSQDPGEDDEGNTGV